MPQIWAAQHIGYLLDEIRLNGEDRETKDEIIEIARKYGIVTPYTSFLIVEEEGRHRTAGETNPALQPMRTAVSRDESFQKKIKEAYGNIHNKDGKGSIDASSEIYALQNTRNQNQIYQGKERLAYRDSSGNKQNLASQVKNIQDRAVYQSNNVWIDSEIQKVVQNAKTKKIQFASPEYFDLVKKEPESTQFLALGKNVQFVLNNTIYEIYE